MATFLKVELAPGAEVSSVLVKNAPPAAQERSSAVLPRVTGSFAHHVMLFGSANLLALAVSGALTFLLPRLLTIEGYGYYRLFILYGGFIGLLHFGLLDGALIRWAARPQSRLRADLSGSMVFLSLEHAVLLAPTVVVVVSLYPSRRWLAIALVLYALVWNCTTLGQYALQASKRFSLLSAVTVVNPALLLVSVLLLQRWHRLSISSLIAAFVFSMAASGAWGWFGLRHELNLASLDLRRVWASASFHIRLGWGVLLANAFTGVTIALDRIIVSATFPIRAFAIYAFAANALAVVNTVILSVSRVVFPYLSDGVSPETRVRAYWWGEACLIGLWAISLAGYFPMQWLITRLLPNYLSSLPVLRLLMLTTGMTAVICILHTNYFRSALQLKRLLLGCAGGLLAALALLAMARRTGQLSMMALAMMGAIGLWWLLNELLLQPLTGGNARNLMRTTLVCAGCGGWFIFCSSWANRVLATGAYLALASLWVLLAYRNVLRTVPALTVFPLASVGLGPSE
ncbi:MAG TPA: hypothetical protein VEH30_08750 [Terriglobales bacterium]|nr:hypothetical protein [Terriglobales bacterium]